MIANPLATLQVSSENRAKTDVKSENLGKHFKCVAALR